MATINAQSNKKKEFITIKSGSGDDTITLSDGNFKVWAGKGNDTITLSDGTNIVYTQYGDNTIIAGTGNDKFYAGQGADEFVFNSDIGNDVIYNSNANDSITFGENLKDNEFNFYRFGNDLVITENIHAQTNTITLSKYFKQKSKLNTITQNGNTIEIDKDVIIYSSGKGKIKGTNFNDGITGSNKKDTIYGYGGNDFLMGGKNSDKIYSGSGNNTIILNRGDGHDTLIVDKKAESNTIMFDQGCTMSYSKSGKNLIITATNELLDGQKTADTEAVTVKNFFTSKGRNALTSDLNIELIGDASARSIDTELATAYITQTGYLKKSNTLYGATDYNNEITGGNKSDKIIAGDFNNRLYGGKGNDKYYVTSENIDAVTKIFDISGNDTYSVKSLDTSTYISDSTGKDTLKISDNVKYTMIFDVSADGTAVEYDSLFLVGNNNIQDKSYTEYTAGGIEIANYFNGDKFGDGRIEKITVGGKTADTTLSHFDEIRSNVAAWLNLRDNGFTSTTDAFDKGSAEQIQQLIAVYQGSSVQI